MDESSPFRYRMIEDKAVRKLSPAMQYEKNERGHLDN